MIRTESFIMMTAETLMDNLNESNTDAILHHFNTLGHSEYFPEIAEVMVLKGCKDSRSEWSHEESLSACADAIWEA